MPDNNKESIENLRLELENALRFLHTFNMQSKIDLIDITSRLLTLIEELVASSAIDLRSFEKRRQMIAERETERMNKEGHVKVMVCETEDKYAMTELPEINCAQKLPSCKARCCTFGFALSIQDLNEGIVRWNYGLPYHIKQNEDSYCEHVNRETMQCAVYENRPAVCRTYDCRKDQRVWTDFDKNIVADIQKE